MTKSPWKEILIVGNPHNAQFYRSEFDPQDIVPVSSWWRLHGTRVDMIWYTGLAQQDKDWDKVRDRLLNTLLGARDLEPGYVFTRFRNIDFVPDLSRRFLV